MQAQIVGCFGVRNGASHEPGRSVEPLGRPLSEDKVAGQADR